MQAFKTALRVVARHPAYLLIYVGFLSCMGLFTTGSVSLGQSEDPGTASRATFAVVDRDDSELSRGLAAFLAERGEPEAVADDPFALQDAVATGKASYVLIIPAGYEREFLAAARSGDPQPVLECAYSYESVSGTLANEQANQYLGLVRSAASLEPDADAGAVIARADEAASASADVRVVESETSSLPADRFAFYLQWTAYTMTISIVVCVGLLMSAFNRTDVRCRNAASPIGTVSLGMQKAAACLLVAGAVWAVSCGVGVAAFGWTLDGLPGYTIASMLASALVFALVPLGMGFLLGQLGAGEMASNAVGNIAGLAMSFLGGSWISLDLLAPEVQTLARFSPTYWYNRAVSSSVHLQGCALSDLLPTLQDLGIVALFALALFAIALAAGRLRIQAADSEGARIGRA